MRPAGRPCALPALSYLPQKKNMAELPSPKFPSGGLKCLILVVNHYLGTSAAAPSAELPSSKKKMAELPSPKFPSGGLKCLNHYLGSSAAAPTGVCCFLSANNSGCGCRLGIRKWTTSQNCPKHTQFVFPASGRGLLVFRHCSWDAFAQVLDQFR